MLRDRLVTAQLGVRTLSGLVGNIAFGRQTGASTAYWPGEATNITSESNLTIGTVAMAPNEVGAYVDVSRRLLAQSTPGAEGLIRSDILSQVALAVDTAFFHGGGGAEPTGLVNTNGVGTVNAAGIDWPALVEFETDVAAANADIGSMYMVVDAAGRGIMKTRPRETGYPLYLIGDDGRANGYPVVATNLLTTGYAFFGVYSTAIIGEWGVMQILVDPYTGGIAGLTRFIINHLVDVGIRQPAAFTFASNLS
jgi:HK97 family phage major capsid protein